MKKGKVLKVLTSLVPVVALAVNALADHLSNKERDEKYVSKEELSELLNKKES